MEIYGHKLLQGRLRAGDSEAKESCGETNVVSKAFYVGLKFSELKSFGGPLNISCRFKSSRIHSRGVKSCNTQFLL